ncbi:MAG: leucine-rich repeat domain-containing protein [Bacteroidetes bacterium]|nr:leucine-rich repeat domain-containing protein [Bacteroidota bacterium]
MKKLLILVGIILCVSKITSAQEELFNQRDIEIYQKEATQLVNYFEYTLNLIGSSKTLPKEKNVIINQSYSKIFKDEFVQIEDDLDEYRTVPTNKNIQAYLKDIDFFFKHTEFHFSIEEVTYHFTEDQQLYFKFQINRNLIGHLINGDSINTNKVRFIEINFNNAKQDLKIASIYTTKLNENKELQNWWNTTSEIWKNILGKDQYIHDSIYLPNIISFTDSTFVASADSLLITEIDTFFIEGSDSIFIHEFDTLQITYVDTVVFDPAPFYNALKEIVSITELQLADNNQITDLAPLSKLTNLQSIDISNTNITDPIPIRNLTKLESLYCSGSKIQSLAALKYLTNLRVLNINNTEVDKLYPLQNLTGLEFLHFNSTKIDSIQLLAEFTHLTDLRFANTSITDLGPLSQLKSLEVLNFNVTNVHSIDALAGLENLRILMMDNTRVDDLLPLANLKNLKRVYCDNSRVTAIKVNQFMQLVPQSLIIFESEEMNQWWADLSTPWKTVFKKYRDLDESPSKEQLHELLKLKIIDLSNRSGIKNLAPLQKMIYLEHLNCSQSSVANLRPLEDLIDLRYLDFSNTKVNSIEPLQNLHKLELVYFSNTDVSDLSAFNSLGFLQQIHCVNTQVKDLTPLAKLSNLKSVYCDNTPVELTDYLKFRNSNKHSLIIFQTNLLSDWWEGLSVDWKQVFTKKLNLTVASLSKEDIHRITNIESLDINNNLQLRSLEPIRILANLKEFKFSGTQLTDLSPLIDLEQISTIECANNPISNLEVLMRLVNLSFLNISNIPIRDFEQIQHMTKLETLICPGTQIKNLKYLEYLTNLKVLECYNTNIKNLNPLAGIRLEILKCYNTGLTVKRVDKFKAEHPNCEVVYY